jgi:hypothetical protein
MNSLPEYNQIFSVQFPNGESAQAIRVKPNADPTLTLHALGFIEPRPVLFISGGAGNMSKQDKHYTHEIIQGIAEFAHEHKLVVLDGGTESGIMKMIGDTRHAAGYTFPLIGISPMGRVEYPGYDNPRQQATLEDNHTHFILVDTPEWGDESMMIVRTAYALCHHNQQPVTGVLVNGGKIAMQEVYLATTHKESQTRMGVIVLEGSGRAADEISTAFRTGKTNQRILRAILAGGDIQLVGTVEGPEAMRQKLAKKFLGE